MDRGQENSPDNQFNRQEIAQRAIGLLRRYFPKKDELVTKIFSISVPGEGTGKSRKIPVPGSLDKIFLKLLEEWQLGEELENGWQKASGNNQEDLGFAKKIIPFDYYPYVIPEAFGALSYLCRVRDEQSFWPMVKTLLPQTELKIAEEKEQFLQSMLYTVFGGVDFYAFLPKTKSIDIH